MFVIGDSYIYHLDQQLKKEDVSTDWTFQGIRGGRISHIRCAINSLLPSNYSGMLFLQIGGNDLQKGTNPMSVVTEAIDLITEIRGRFPDAVVLYGSIIPRERPGRGQTAEEYLEKARTFNNCLSSLIREKWGEMTIFWNHKRHFKPHGHFFRDGVHLNNLGNMRMFFSIRTGYRRHHH